MDSSKVDLENKPGAGLEAEGEDGLQVEPMEEEKDNSRGQDDVGDAKQGQETLTLTSSGELIMTDLGTFISTSTMYMYVQDL